MTRTVAQSSPVTPEIQPVPPGFRLDLDPSLRQPKADVLVGGTPLRYLRLSPAGAQAWTHLRAAPVSTRAQGLLARRLFDAGLAHPVPPPGGGPSPADVTVVIPVFDRSPQLARCLAAVAVASGGEVAVVVVDDGSADPEAIAAVATEHGARVIRRDVNGGPAAARNTGLAVVGHTDSRFVALLDSDCEPPPGWLEPLLAHLADPMVAAVAPRIVGAASRTAAGRYTAARGNLDLGAVPSRVRAGARVAYVPTAALVVRVAGLQDIARDGDVFDPGLRFGEDVDLVWRLDAAGWRVRYQPGSYVVHHDPDRWRALLARRRRYGTSAVPLAAAHPDCTAPLVIAPWPALAVAAVLARRPVGAAVALVTGAALTRRRLQRADLPTDGVGSASIRAAHATWLGVGRYVTQFAAPVAVAVAAAPGPVGRRIAAASLLLGGPLTVWWPRRRMLDPARFTAGYLADEIAYGAGVWSAALSRGDLRALRPRVLPFAAPPRSTRHTSTKESRQ